MNVVEWYFQEIGKAWSALYLRHMYGKSNAELWAEYFTSEMDADAREYEERCKREEQRKLERLEYRDLHGR